MNLQFIPTRVHGVLDYIHGAALLAAPELLGTKNEPRAALVSRLAGGVTYATALLRAPSGPLAGEHSAVQTLVLVRGGDGWEIAGFHNTLVAPQRR